MRARSFLAVTAAALAAAPAVSPAAPGDLDPSFGTGGVSRTPTPVGTGAGTLADIDLTPTGAIVGAGSARFDSDFPTRAYAGRWLLSGSVDPAFGIRVLEKPDVNTDLQSTDGNAVAATPTGGAVLGGQYRKNGSRSGLIASYASNGGLDLTFGGGAGYVIASSGSGGSFTSNGVTAVVRLADGRVLAGGTFYGLGRTQVELQRFTTTGQLDPTFSEDGRARFATRPTDPSDGLGDLVADGNAVFAVGGGKTPEGDSVFTVLRLREDGTPDPDYGTAGRAIARFAAPTGASKAVRAPDGGLVLAGRIDEAAGGDEGRWALTKLDADGDVDRAFGNDGLRVVDVVGRPTGLELDPNGRILVTGLTYDGGDQFDDGGFTVARLTAAGDLDRSFGRGDGIAQPLAAPSRSTDIVVLGDGSAIVSGDSVLDGRSVPTLVKVEGGGASPAPAGGGGGQGSGSGDQGSGGGSSSSAGGVAGSGASTSGIPIRIVGRMRGLKLQLLGKRPSRGALRFRVGWAQGSKGRGEIKVHATRRGKRVLVASLRFTISGGTGATLRVPLTVTGRRIFGAVRKNGRTPVRATLTATPAP